MSIKRFQLAWGLIAAGIFLRLELYLHNCSFWLDEACLALNILHKNMIQLWRPLDYHQAAPLLFLSTQKFFVCVLGNHEYAFRIFPLLGGIAAIVLFYRILEHFVWDQADRLLALGLFCFSGRLIYYSSECKQYSTDVFFILLLLHVWRYSHQGDLKAHRLLLFAAVGMTLIWFSHPVIFALTAIGLVEVASRISKNEWKDAGQLSAFYMLWALSFIINAVVALYPTRMHSKAWGFAFFPLSLNIQRTLAWVSKSIMNDFIYLTGIKLTEFNVLAGVLAVLGCGYLFLKNIKLFCVWTVLLLTVLLASALHLYPFWNRFLVFMAPFLFILIANGVSLIRGFPYRNMRLWANMLTVLILFLFLADTGFYVFGPVDSEPMKPVLEYVRSHQRPGDECYVDSFSAPAFIYYRSQYGLDQMNCSIGQEPKHDRDLYKKELKSLTSSPRVWIILSPRRKIRGAYYREYFKKNGFLISAFCLSGAAAYLYDLTKKNSIPRI